VRRVIDDAQGRLAAGLQLTLAICPSRKARRPGRLTSAITSGDLGRPPAIGQDRDDNLWPR